MNAKGKVLAELGDENQFWDTALLCDISQHVNNLNTRFQGQQKLVSDMFEAVKVFGIKLKLFPKQLENVNLCRFSYCDLFRNDESVG